MLTFMKLPHHVTAMSTAAPRRGKLIRALSGVALLLVAPSAFAQSPVPVETPAPPAAAAPPAGPLPELPASAPQYDDDGVPATAEPTDPAGYDIATDTDPSALNTFREPLAPYGTWDEDATYGVVWTPHAAVVGADFTPYVSHGHWGLGADNSWLWVSDFNWGWAPFHYGRWVWIGGRGWAWIPGRVYAPAWVVWRTGMYDDYYVGWAPMPPTWYWRGGFAYSLWRVPQAPYVFCSASYVFSPHVRSYIAPPGRVAAIAPRTRPYIAASGALSANYRAAAFTRGPNPTEAHIPAGAMPSQRVSPDPRAMAFARPSPSSGPRSFAGSPGGFNGQSAMRPMAPGAASYGQRPLAPGAPNGYGQRPFSPGAPNGYSRPLANGPALGDTARPYAGPALPQTPSARPMYPAPSEIPRPTPGANGGGSMRPMAPSWGSSGGSMRPAAPSWGSSGGSMRPMAPSGGGGSMRPAAPSFGGGGSMRPAAPSGGGGRPRAR